jgi:predicted MFS family arabinose efflux permease
VTKADAPVSPLAIAALSFAAFASAASTRVADPLLPRFDAEFAIGVGTAAQVVTAFSIAYGALQAFYGPIGDRFRQVPRCRMGVCRIRIDGALLRTGPDVRRPL